MEKRTLLSPIAARRRAGAVSSGLLKRREPPGRLHNRSAGQNGPGGERTVFGLDYGKNSVTGIRLAYIGGGSRGWARSLMSDLAQEPALAGTVRLYDIDAQAAADNETIGNALSARGDAAGKLEYKAVGSLREALTGADFVIISILPGTFEEMRSDVHAPEKYGIYQSVGDTAGPGGVVRALRTVPMFEEIALAIRDWAPHSWVINYTNPMTVCVRTLYKVFPGIKAFGCCHEVFGTQKLLAAALHDILGEGPADRSEIRTNVLGVNHFTWIDRAGWRGTDILPVYRRFVDKYYDAGFEGNVEKGNWMNNTFASCERVKFDLFRRYGVIAAAGDRHLAEFCPGKWYLKDPETVRDWKFGLTTVQWRIDDLHQRLEKSRRLLSGEERFELNHTGEEGVRQIKALLGVDDLVTNVNIPNVGQMKDVPLGAVVETNAFFSRDSVRPVASGRLPDPVLGLVLRQVMNQETVAEAALKKDYEAAFAAFVNDPLVTVSLRDARRLYREMLENTKAYLR